MSKALLISSDATLHRLVEDVLQRTCGCRYVGIDSCAPKFDDIADAAPSVILAHLTSPEQGRSFVLPLVDKFSTRVPATPIIVIADEYRGREFRDLLVHGASECLTRPLDAARLTFLIKSLNLGNRPVVTAASPLEKVVEEAGGGYRDVCEKALRVASKNMVVLLTGETGVGKTHLARLIHGSSPRRSHPFVALNCGAISEHLAESELFGHRKGAFTGASDNYEGHLAAAGNGTLFLDEVDSLSVAMQGKLLHVLDDRMFMPVGSVTPQKFRARLIAATNQRIEQAVAEGRFRRDLYFRISVAELKIPPLRERKEEIRPLAMSFLQELCQAREPVPHVPEETWQRLEKNDWPGNLRELRNAIEYAHAFMQGNVLRPELLPALCGVVPVTCPASTDASPTEIGAEKASTGKDCKPLDAARNRGERQKLLSMLELHKFNKTRVADELGISRNGLYKRLRALGI